MLQNEVATESPTGLACDRPCLDHAASRERMPRDEPPQRTEGATGQRSCKLKAGAREAILPYGHSPERCLRDCAKSPPVCTAPLHSRVHTQAHLARFCKVAQGAYGAPHTCGPSLQSTVNSPTVCCENQAPVSRSLRCVAQNERNPRV